MVHQAKKSPVSSQGPDRRPDFLDQDIFPFESRWLEIEGHRIHYVDEGKGPVLVLYHGNPAYSFLFRKIIPLLKDSFRCIAFDYPGFGLSRAAAGYSFLPAEHAKVSQAVLEALKIKKYTPVMSDWGGPIGLRVAEMDPKKVESLIIGNTFAWPVNGDLHFEWFSRFFGGPLGYVLIRHFHAFVRMLMPAGTRIAELSKKEMNAYLAPMPTPDSRMPTYIFPREIRKSKDFLHTVDSNLNLLAEKKTLFLWGDADIAFRDRELKRFESRFPDHRTVILRGAGHFIWQDSPIEIAAAISEQFRKKK